MHPVVVFIFFKKGTGKTSLGSLTSFLAIALSLSQIMVGNTLSRSLSLLHCGFNSTLSSCINFIYIFLELALSFVVFQSKFCIFFLFHVVFILYGCFFVVIT